METAIWLYQPLRLQELVVAVVWWLCLQPSQTPVVSIEIVLYIYRKVTCTAIAIHSLDHFMWRWASVEVQEQECFKPSSDNIFNCFVNHVKPFCNKKVCQYLISPGSLCLYSDLYSGWTWPWLLWVTQQKYSQSY